MNLTDKINELLPQTQCTRCGYPSCKSYAKAINDNRADINQCPPGKEAGIHKLAQLLNKPYKPLNPENGKVKPIQLAIIDEDACIGCTLCIKACPVDAIIGSNKMMHTVIASECTGCELCVPICPVDCIILQDDTNQGWDSNRQQKAKARYERRQMRKLEGSDRARRKYLNEQNEQPDKMKDSNLIEQIMQQAKSEIT